MTDIVLFTDVHIRHTTPPSRSDNYYDTVVRKLTQVVQFAKDTGSILICCGDLFHFRSASSTPYFVTNALIELFSDNHLFIVSGNHDLSTVHELRGQPLETLIKSGVASSPQEPFLLEGVMLNFIHYSPRMREDILPNANGILFSHFEISSNPQRFDQIKKEELSMFDKVFNGHDHVDKVEGTLYRLCPLVRPSLGLIDSKNTPSFYHISLPSLEVKRYVVDYEGVEDIQVRKVKPSKEEFIVLSSLLKQERFTSLFSTEEYLSLLKKRDINVYSILIEYLNNE